MALIICPECNGKVSDKATMCIHCGCPASEFANISNSNTQASVSIENEIKALNKPKTKRKRMRLPNGYGHIQQFKDRRRNPFIAYAPVSFSEYTDDGKPPKRTTLGAFPTYNKALECLAAWHNTHDNNISDCPTFKQIWEKIIEREENLNPELEHGMSKSKYLGYNSAFNRCESLHNKPINKIYTEDMQNIIDENSHMSKPSLANLVKLYHWIFKYANQNNYVDKDYSSFVKIDKGVETEKGIPFSENEIKILWDNKDDVDTQVVLILIYSGMRITELKKTKIDLDQKVFIGGIKTDKGKERTIPIHDGIFDFVKNFNQQKFSPDDFRKRKFYPLMEKLNMQMSEQNTKRTPHDTRHTFSWLADKYKIDTLSKHMIMGHALGKDVESNTYGHRTLEELKNEINKIEISVR